MTSIRKLEIIRWVSLSLAVAIPLLFTWTYYSKGAELRALKTRGLQVQGVVTNLSRSGATTFVHFRYTVAGVDYAWNVDGNDAPGTIGAPLAVTYLPENPGRPWVGPPLNDKAIREKTTSLLTAIPLALGVFSLSFLVNEIQLRRQRPLSGNTPVRPLWSPTAATMIVWLVVLAALLGANFDPRVRAIQEKILGLYPLGMPTVVFVIVVTLILYAPYYWVFRHFIVIIQQARIDRAGRGKTGLLLYLLNVGRLHPELRRSQAVVVAGIAFFAAIGVAWIAYTSYIRAL